MVFEVKGSVALTERVTLRLASDEKDKLRLDADLAGLSVSEIVRRHYFGRPVIANSDLAMIKELRRMGGLINQLHIASAGAYSEQTSAAIDSIVKYIDTLTSVAKNK